MSEHVTEVVEITPGRGYWKCSCGRRMGEPEVRALTNVELGASMHPIQARKRELRLGTESAQEWAHEVLRARKLAQQAKVKREHALELRCPERESGGIRCTRDAGHEGDCRIRREDMP